MDIMDRIIDITLEEIGKAAHENPEYQITPEQTEIIVNDFKKHYSKAAILNAAQRDGERPFGPVITWLRDYYGIPKSKGVKIADRILDDYGLPR